MGTFATSWTVGDVIPASELNTLSGAWTSYTPTVGGSWALGNGTISGNYKKIGRLVVCEMVVTWGSTSTFGASGLTLTLPFQALRGNALGKAKFTDTGTAGYQGVCWTTAASTTLGLYVYTTGGTYAGESSIVTTAPHTWASTDIVNCTIAYESTS